MGELYSRVERGRQYIGFNLCLNTCRASTTQRSKLKQIRRQFPTQTGLSAHWPLEHPSSIDAWIPRQHALAWLYIKTIRRQCLIVFFDFCVSRDIVTKVSMPWQLPCAHMMSSWKKITAHMMSTLERKFPCYAKWKLTALTRVTCARCTYEALEFWSNTSCSHISWAVPLKIQL